MFLKDDTYLIRVPCFYHFTYNNKVLWKNENCNVPVKLYPIKISKIKKYSTQVPKKLK